MKRGAYLKQLREERGLSLRDVEKKTGISNSLLSQIERGIRSLTFKTAGSLAQVYGTPAIELMKRDSGDQRDSRKRAEFDYEVAYGEIVQKYLQHTGFTKRAFEEVPTPVKKLVVQLEAKMTGREVEPFFSFFIRDSTNNAFTEFAVRQETFQEAILVNASIAAACLATLRVAMGTMDELFTPGRRVVKEMSDQDFVESLGLHPVIVSDSTPYYDLAGVLREIAEFAADLQQIAARSGTKSASHSKNRRLRNRPK